MSSAVNSYKLLIDGQLQGGARSIDIVDPATGTLLDVAPAASEAQLHEAVAAAKRAFPGWSALSYEAREERLNTLADAVEANAEDLTRLLTREQGKPLAEAGGEVHGMAAALRAYGAMRPAAGLLREDATSRIVEIRKPLGVVAAIVPWNYPLMLMAMKIGPGLVTGNTFVVKPAPTTPLTALAFGRLAADILPQGVLNIIVDDNDLGSLLTSHPDVAKVSFTGSVGVGRKVMANAAPTLKRLTLELGGNDAALVLDDADVATVAPAIFAAAMSNAGQVCTGTKRVYAPAALYDRLCDALAALAKEARVGNGLDPEVTVGPLQNRAQLARIQAIVRQAAADGTVIAGGGGADVGPAGESGFFVAPTIVKDIDDSAQLVREEQFGPVLPILRYHDLDDAIARINDSPLGLAGSVWTSDLDRGIAVAARIDAGTTWVNKAVDVPFDIPFRGAKQSGLGGENGQEAMMAYTQGQIINAAL